LSDLGRRDLGDRGGDTPDCDAALVAGVGIPSESQTDETAAALPPPAASTQTPRSVMRTDVRRNDTTAAVEMRWAPE
jgi:hypothetical protein